MHPSPMGRRTSGSLLVALAVWAALSMQSLFAMPKGSSDGVQESRENVGRDVNRWRRTLLPTKYYCMFYILYCFSKSKVFQIIPVGLCCRCCHTLRSRIMVCFWLREWGIFGFLSAEAMRLCCGGRPFSFDVITVDACLEGLRRSFSEAFAAGGCARQSAMIGITVCTPQEYSKVEVMKSDP